MKDKRIELIPLDTVHEKYIVKWRNNQKISESLFSSNTVTLESHRQWFKKYKESTNRKEFIINITDGDIPIGTIGLSSIDRINMKAEYGILIGETEYFGKGYAKEASFLILKYAFVELLLNKVYLRVFDNNERALGMYKSLGFSFDGILRQDVFKEGKFLNIIEMSFLREEWKNV